MKSEQAIKRLKTLGPSLKAKETFKSNKFVIQQTFKKRRLASSTILWFGRHKGKTLIEVESTDPNYVSWMRKNMPEIIVPDHIPVDPSYTKMIVPQYKVFNKRKYLTREDKYPDVSRLKSMIENS